MIWLWTSSHAKSYISAVFIKEVRVYAIDKLKVYDRALASVASLARLSGEWDKRHAVVDQLVRASESVLLNLAEGVRLRGVANRRIMLDYAIGSALECAACLDVARVKQFLEIETAVGEKESLCEVVKMLVGLRKAWAEDTLAEESRPYDGRLSVLFPHERLEAYQVSLALVRWFDTLPGGAELSCRLFRQIDKSVTSVVLNLAEGNGRHMDSDRRRFLDIAESSAMKAATYLDLCERTAMIDRKEKQTGGALLDRMASMLCGLHSHGG